MAKRVKKRSSIELPEKVAEQYELVSPPAGKFYQQPFGEIDLRHLTLKQAAHLVSKKVSFIRLKK